MANSFGSSNRLDEPSAGRSVARNINPRGASSVPTDSNPLRPSASHPATNHHHRVGSMVGSLGRQGFHMPLSKREREQARTLVFSDRLNDEQPFNTSASSVPSLPFTNTVREESDSDDANILEEGIFAPSEAQRIYTEQHELLRESARNTYGSTRAGAEELANHASVDSESYPGWNDALLGGKITTSVSLELKTLVLNAVPLAITFMLQYSLIMSSLFCVGHLGKVELGAVSLGGMTASITGTAFIQGMSTCLDTLCSQAYGAGRPDLVGLYFQKGVLVVMLGLLPVLMLWYRADLFLPFVVANEEEDSEKLVELATSYLRVMIFAMPGFCLFECGKRFMQAQGIFHASTMVLVICAPLNIFITYTLVWNQHIGLGFIGAPIAVAITNTMLALLLFLYVLLVDGSQCWNGFTWKVFRNWGPLVQLAIPGLVMVESEFLAYEIMTLASSYLGTNDLATQTILSSITSLAYEAPFAFGCAGSTRVASFVGAGLESAAKLAMKVTMAVGLVVGLTDALIIFSLRHTFSSLFSSDPAIINRAARFIPFCALVHLLDAVGAVLAGILRGQGRQSMGGYINLSSYYMLGVPLGLFLCFGPLKLGLAGIWIGFITALVGVVTASLVALKMSKWDRYIHKARERN